MSDGDLQPPVRIPAAVVDFILLGPQEDRRLLQDAPILGDVWLGYAGAPGEPQDLLITPLKTETAVKVALAIRERRNRAAGSGERRAARIAYLQGLVAARLTFRELMTVVAPLTEWCGRERTGLKAALQGEERAGLLPAIRGLLKEVQERRTSGSDHVTRWSPNYRYLTLAGLLFWAARHNGDRPAPRTEALDEFERALSGVTAEALLAEVDEVLGPVLNEPARPDELIWIVSRNRKAGLALEKSVPAVKADAARSLFSVSCKDIAWAVLDSGIDASHPAFGGRVKGPYDFTRMREIVSLDNLDRSDSELEALAASFGLAPEEAAADLRAFAENADKGRSPHWGLIEKFIKAPPPPDARPLNPHGTHVAGIIGADGRGPDRSGTNPDGLCPDIQLYDFRVVARNEEDTEFAVVAALQYIRWLNERHSFVTIHGANLSLSIPHDVRNFACGRTPVCQECERLVNSGVVVVAAAGNRGYHNFETSEGSFESYAAFSITDPGNADEVITVGATHRYWPHTYGVSFFSSRGPTGDGRRKPDLVAPGERIQSPTPGNEWTQESGTSMAAPHVSGAAAMLLARYPELIGHPRRIKQILCDSATDLGRDRSFQGAGMLDVLRAFQSL